MKKPCSGTEISTFTKSYTIDIPESGSTDETFISVSTDFISLDINTDYLSGATCSQTFDYEMVDGSLKPTYTSGEN